MSNDAINWVLGNRRNEPGLRGPKNAQRLVLLVLANYASDDGECFPGIDTISHEANLTRGTTKTALAWLIENGYLERDVKAHSPRRGSRQPRNIYRLIWTVEIEGSKFTPSVDEQEGVKFASERGGISGDRGVEIPQSAEVAPISLNPSNPNCEPASPQAGSAEALTVNQRAQKIQRGYWDWVTERTGHHPVLGAVALQRIVARLLTAGRSDRDVKHALVAVHSSGRTITGQGLEAEIDGRRPFTRPRTVDEQLDSERAAGRLEYGPDGMLLG